MTLKSNKTHAFTILDLKYLPIKKKKEPLKKDLDSWSWLNSLLQKVNT